MTPEGRVKAAVKRWLDARGAWYCMPMGTGFGKSGVPDFICCLAGKFLAIETKAPGKRGATTPLQDREIAAIIEAKGAALVVDDVAQLDVLDRVGVNPLRDVPVRSYAPNSGGTCA